MSQITRSQSMMELAIEHVREVKKITLEKPKVGDIYGTLSHKFPVLVRTCGLCQAVAFIESKQSSNDNDRKKAHKTLVKHIKEVLSANGINSDGDPSKDIAGLPMIEYIRATRVILNAWIYYKRFAESILGVASDSGKDEAG